jgi:Domain of unknown function (DUF4352)
MDQTTITPPSQPQKARRHRFRNFVVIPLAALAGLIVIIGIAGAVTGSGSKTVKTPAAAASPAVPATPAAPSTQDLTGPLGAAFTVTETDAGTGAQDSYTVTAVTVLDPAQGSGQFSTADAGKRLVGVQFQITGTQGYAHDDANLDASLQGSDGQVYQPDFTTLAIGTNFSSGDFSVTAGKTQTGWVTFQVPAGVKVSSVQWQSDITGDSQPATWQT